MSDKDIPEEEVNTQDVTLEIKSIGLNGGESFVMGEGVRMWGIIGTVKIIRQRPDDYLVEVWRRISTLAEEPQYEITIVQIPSASIAWVAAGYLYSPPKDEETSEEE